MNLLHKRLQHAAQVSNPPVRQADIVRKTDITKGTLSGWFSGKTNDIKSSDLFKIADVLKVSARWLATGDGEMQVKEEPGIYLVSSNQNPKPESINVQRLEEALERINRNDTDFCDRPAKDQAMLIKFSYDTIDD